MATSLIVCGAAGRMGRTLVSLAAHTDATVVAAAVEAPGHPSLGRDVGDLAGVGPLGIAIGSDLSAVCRPESVVLDFTNADAAMATLRIAVAAGGAIVLGSTGFSEVQQREIDDLAPRIRSVVAANMSVGVTVLERLAREAARVLGDGFDPEIVEIHHRMKVDAPSGTALSLGRAVAEATGRMLQTDAVYGRQGLVGRRTPAEIGILAVRGGDVVGEHTVYFAGMGERLELTHRAQSRDCLARGALRAALWLDHQPPGRYSMADVLGLT